MLHSVLHNFSKSLKEVHKYRLFSSLTRKHCSGFTGGSGIL